jgi:hypothetical protein
LRTGSFAIWEQDQARFLNGRQAFLDQLFTKGVEDRASLDAHRRAAQVAYDLRVTLPGVALYYAAHLVPHLPNSLLPSFMVLMTQIVGC